MQEYINSKTKHVYLKLMQKSHFIYCVHNKLEVIPEGYDIHHIDHNTLNNHISNLELIERRKHGILHTNHKLVDVDWNAIYDEWKSESFLTKTEIAEKLLCSRKTVLRHFKKIEIMRAEMNFEDYKTEVLKFGKVIKWNFVFETHPYDGITLMSGLKKPFDKVKWFSADYVRRQKDWSEELRWLKYKIMRAK